MAGAFSGTVTGFVAKDPESAANGKAAKFSIPVNKGKDSPTTWVRVTAWGKTAEFVMQYVKKGALVAASGTLETREFEGKNGKQTSVELNAGSVQSFRTGNDTPAPKPAAVVEPEDIGF